MESTFGLSVTELIRDLEEEGNGRVARSPEVFAPVS
jgi:hypothetical protein